MDAADDRDLVLARRLKLGVRLVVYPLLLGLVALVWHVRHADGAQEPRRRGPISRPVTSYPRYESWVGDTGRSWVVSASSTDASLSRLAAPVALRCDDGDPFTFRLEIWFADGERRADAVEATRAEAGVHADDGSPMAYTARVDAHLGGLPAGHLAVTVLWDRPQGRTRCVSGPVAFALRRS
jgi:hypothetical protein